MSAYLGCLYLILYTSSLSRHMHFGLKAASASLSPRRFLLASGNEAVLQARFQDALFFYNSDLEQDLSEFVPALANITFQRDLGSILDKSRRVEQLIPKLAILTNLQGAHSH